MIIMYIRTIIISLGETKLYVQVEPKLIFSEYFQFFLAANIQFQFQYFSNLKMPSNFRKPQKIRKFKISELVL